MVEQAFDGSETQGYGEVNKILHEIVDEPGPRFSCYCLGEEEHRLRCEIHYNGRKKAPILLSENQVWECCHSDKGRQHIKELLRREIDGLIVEESWYDQPLSQDWD